MATKRAAEELDVDAAVLAAVDEVDPRPDAPPSSAGSGSGSDSDSETAPAKKKPRGPRKPEKPAAPQKPANPPAVSRCADGSPSLPLAAGDSDDGSPGERVRFTYALVHWMEQQTRPDGEELYKVDTRKNIAASIPRILDALEGDLGRLPNFPLLGSDRGPDGKLLPIDKRPVGQHCVHVRALWKELPESALPVLRGTWHAAVEQGLKGAALDDRSEYWVMNNEVLRSGFCGFDTHDKLAQAVKVMYQFCYGYLVTLSFEGKGWADLTRFDDFAKLLLKKTVTEEAVPEKKKKKPSPVPSPVGDDWSDRAPARPDRNEPGGMLETGPGPDGCWSMDFPMM